MGERLRSVSVVAMRNVVSVGVNRGVRNIVIVAVVIYRVVLVGSTPAMVTMTVVTGLGGTGGEGERETNDC